MVNPLCTVTDDICGDAAYFRRVQRWLCKCVQVDHQMTSSGRIVRSPLKVFNDALFT